MLNLLNQLLFDLFAFGNLFLHWLFSSHSSGLLTFFTGLVAGGVYWLQLRLRRKEAARVLIYEISYIEGAIGERERINFYDEIYIISPTFSWFNNFHLFVSFLSSNEFGMLSDFFSKARAAQNELDKLRAYYHESNLQKARSLQELLFDLSRRCVGKTKDEYLKQRNEEIFHSREEGINFSPDLPKNNLKKHLGNIPKIIGTTIFSKINKLASSKI